MPWCTIEEVPKLLIRDLFIAKILFQTEIYAFCILPDHMHIILRPGEYGLSRFIKSFKENSSRNIRRSLFHNRDDRVVVATERGNTHSGIVATGAEEMGILRTEDIPFTGWQHGFHDERIRDETQRDTALSYVRHNAWRHMD